MSASILKGHDLFKSAEIEHFVYLKIWRIAIERVSEYNTLKHVKISITCIIWMGELYFYLPLASIQCHILFTS